METWKYIIIRNFIILCPCPFSKILHLLLGSEPGTPLVIIPTILAFLNHFHLRIYILAFCLFFMRGPIWSESSPFGTF